jgi:hypothetical protein
MFRPPLSPYLLRAPIPSALPFFAKFFGSPATTPPPTLAAAAASTGPSKFAFTYGVAFAGKPRRRGEQIPRGLAGGGEKGSWRSAMLAWGKERDAGEDFFMLREGEDSQVRALGDGRLASSSFSTRSTTLTHFHCDFSLRSWQSRTASVAGPSRASTRRRSRRRLCSTPGKRRRPTRAGPRPSCFSRPMTGR